MHAIVYHRYGTPDVLEFQEIATPTPAEDQVLIRVHAASVNPYDWHFLRGTPAPLRLMTGVRRPKFPRLGADVAGLVEAVGAKATTFTVGDAVFGAGKGSCKLSADQLKAGSYSLTATYAGAPGFKSSVSPGHKLTVT